MQHFNFLLYILAFSTGTVSITVSVLFYRQYRKKVIGYYGLMLCAVAMLLLKRMLEQYFFIAGIPGGPVQDLVIEIVEKTAFVLGILFGPYFCHYLIGLPVFLTRKVVYACIAIVFTVLSAFELIFNHTAIAAAVRSFGSFPLLYGTYLYCLILGVRNWGKLGSVFLNRIFKVIFLVTLAGLPFSIFQYFSEHAFLPGFMEYPLLFLMMNVSTIFFSFKYFDHPAFMENESLTDYFRNKFSISDREAEIVLAVKKGFSNQEIGEKLFISPRTVESHLYTIFQKTGVKNRVQLVNLMVTNQKE
jgi:DNA-binding CsgD family transcriptional regulator